MTTPSPDERIERDVESIRDEIALTLEELDARRRELLDWRLQLRRHAGVVTALVLLAGGAVALAIWRRRQRSRPMGRVRRWRAALARMISNPEDLARSRPGLGSRAATSAATGAAGVVAKSLTRRLFSPWSNGA